MQAAHPAPELCTSIVSGHVDGSLKGKLVKWPRVFGFTVHCAQSSLSVGSLWPFAFPPRFYHSYVYPICLIFLPCIPLCFSSFFFSVWEVRKPVVVLFSCQCVYTSGLCKVLSPDHFTCWFIQNLWCSYLTAKAVITIRALWRANLLRTGCLIAFWVIWGTTEGVFPMIQI